MWTDAIGDGAQASRSTRVALLTDMQQLKRYFRSASTYTVYAGLKIEHADIFLLFESVII